MTIFDIYLFCRLWRQGGFYMLTASQHICLPTHESVSGPNINLIEFLPVPNIT